MFSYSSTIVTTNTFRPLIYVCVLFIHFSRIVRCFHSLFKREKDAIIDITLFVGDLVALGQKNKENPVSLHHTTPSPVCCVIGGFLCKYHNRKQQKKKIQGIEKRDHGRRVQQLDHF